jgi:hypothetical protein
MAARGSNLNGSTYFLPFLMFIDEATIRCCINVYLEVAEDVLPLICGAHLERGKDALS